MTRQTSEFVVVGAILGAHGVRGDVRVKSFTALPEDVFAYAPLLAENGAILIEPVRVRAAKDHFVVSPKIQKQKEEWDALKGTRLYIPRDTLPEPEDEEYYIEDLVGLDVFAGGDARIGRIKAVLNHGASDLIEIQADGLKRVVLVPFTHEDVPVIDIARNRIIVATFDTWADEARPDDAP